LRGKITIRIAQQKRRLHSRPFLYSLTLHYGLFVLSVNTTMPKTIAAAAAAATNIPLPPPSLLSFLAATFARFTFDTAGLALAVAACAATGAPTKQSAVAAANDFFTKVIKSLLKVFLKNIRSAATYVVLTI
jgi:hypothetical protein